KLQQFPGSGPDGAGLYVTPACLSNGRPDCDAARHTRRTRPAAAARAPTAAHDVCTPSVRWNLAVAANCGDSTQLTGETAVRSQVKRRSGLCRAHGRLRQRPLEDRPGAERIERHLELGIVLRVVGRSRLRRGGLERCGRGEPALFAFEMSGEVLLARRVVVGRA